MTGETSRLHAKSIWFTNGSRIVDRSGAKFYEGTGRTYVSISLGQYATVFQTEIVAIMECARNILSGVQSGLNNN